MIFATNSPIWLSERKDTIEDGNRALVQSFRAQLSEQLDLLHKTVSASVTKQKNHLEEMEEEMQSFITAKTEVCCNSLIPRSFLVLPK